MKRFFAFIMLLCHINSSMLLPQMAEEDRFDKNGKQIDDINSIAEYIAVNLGYDTTSDDEDDDAGQTFHLSRIDTVYYTPVYCEVVKPVIIKTERKQFPEYRTPALKSMPQNKLTPPPDFSI